MVDEQKTITLNGVTITDTYLHMVRTSLRDLPAWVDAATLPAGYRFRMYRPGDEALWVALHKVAEPFLTITSDHFLQQFGGAEEALPDRMFMVETNAGELVGSGTAWWQNKWREHSDWGKVHWIVVHPHHQRRGLTKPLMARVLHRLRQSHTRAQLGTSTGRVWAIKVYLDCGFHPDPVEFADEKFRTAWREVQSILEHPILREWI